MFSTLAVVIDLLINKPRLDDGLARNFGRGFAETRQRLDDLKTELMADLARFEQVLDARLKHLEEQR